MYSDSVSHCGVWCTHTDTHTHTCTQSVLSLPLLSLSVHIFSFSRKGMYVFWGNVKPLKFTVKAATPPTASPKGFKEHMFLTYAFSEAFKLWEGTGVTWEPKYSPKLCFGIFCWGRGDGMEVTFFFPQSLSLSLSGFSFFFSFSWHPKRTHMTLIKKSCCCYQTLVNLSRQLWRKPHQGRNSKSNAHCDFGPSSKSALFIGSFSVDLCRVSKDF